MNIQHFAFIDNDALGDELSEPVTRIPVKVNSTVHVRARNLAAMIITRMVNGNYSIPSIN